jgi:DNA-binding winged helix-turn-helix (wHTH) protein/tetratricopeptide (TPR) repeat protein
MALGTQSPTILHFGTFEVDLRLGELRKQGKRIKLQDQPFHVLAVLLQRPGEVVTREELRNKNWSPDTFVDFDNSLNTAINKLREALGDSADNPRFIETLPRRGYRFIAPVSSDHHGKTPLTAARWKIVLPVVVVVFVAAALLGGRLWRSSRGRVLTEKDTIVLGDFANHTGDGVFDGTLREGLSVQLEQSPFLSLVSDEGIRQTLRMMGQPANARLTPQITREICQRTSSTTSLTGSIALIGSKYELILRATNCVNGDLLAGTEAQANDKSHVLDALGNAASEMRRKLGESLTSLQKYNTPLEQATTSSLEALQAYTIGLRAIEARDNAASLASFERATQLDPSFAMAYLGMAGSYQGLGETALMMENARKAFALRTEVSELEKLVIEEEYNFYTNGDLMKVRRICELGARTYPRSPAFHEDLGQYLSAVGQYESGLDETLEAIRLVPYDGFLYRQLVHIYLLLNRVDEAEAAAKEARAKNLDANLGDVLYEIGFYRAHAAEMARQADRSAQKPGNEDLLLALEADTAAYSGHLRKAREFSLSAAESADQERDKEAAATYVAVSALREALFGNAVIARQRAADDRRGTSGRDLDFAVALTLAYAGDAKSAQALTEHLAKQFPEDTIVQFNYLPALRAKLALLQADPPEALAVLRAAAPYELGLPALSFYNWPNLYPVYVRGEAYLAAHQGREAAAEFEKILDHRGIALNEPIGALAHLQLGRAYAMQGDTAKARAAYDDFLTLWKDADMDIPILREAKAECVKLK